MESIRSIRISSLRAIATVEGVRNYLKFRKGGKCQKYNQVGLNVKLVCKGYFNKAS